MSSFLPQNGISRPLGIADIDRFICIKKEKWLLFFDPKPIENF